MKKVLLGEFETNGKLIVTDPCYELGSTHTRKLKVKPGRYRAYVLTGRMVKPLFPVDKMKEFFRVAQLIIEHVDEKSFSYKKTTAHIGVDSGQAGFFNIDHYKKDFEQDVYLVGDQFSFFRDSIFTKIREVKELKEALKLKEKNQMYNNFYKRRKNRKETNEFLKMSLEMSQQMMKDGKEFIKTNKFPSWSTNRYSKDFYEVVSDMTKRINYADAYEQGTVAQSGLGDGGYDLFVAKNNKGEIVSAYISFMDEDEVK